MNLDFSKLEFKINWASGVTIVTLLSTVIGLYITNKGLQSEIESVKKNNGTLTTTVGTLSTTVNTLQGSQEVTSKAIEIFMQNPTNELKYRIEKLEDRLNIKETETNKPFTNALPPR